MQLWSRLLSFALCLILGSGCSQEIESGVPFGLKERQYSFWWYAGEPQRLLWMIVIDDAPTDEARALRAQVAAELPGLIDKWRNSSCRNGQDPAIYLPLTLDVILIPTSAPDLALHPGNRPELLLTTPNATTENNSAWESAVARAIVSLESASVFPNNVFGALARWEALVGGSATPSDAPTANFLQTLGSYRDPEVLVATARDDEVGDASFEGFRYYATVLYRNEAVCALPEASRPQPRLASAFRIVRSCDEELFSSGLSCTQYALTCHPSYPERAASGQASCRVFARLQDNSACPREAGWVDPLGEAGTRSPKVSVEPAVEGKPAPPERRVCEILQLEGEARNSCEQDLDCTACAPGFCFREPFSQDLADWDWVARYCSERGAWTTEQVRLVHGADRAKSAELTVICDLESR